MRYYIIAGEVSGDLYGSYLMKALKSADAGAEFRFWGGDLMADAGGTLVQHVNKSSFMGFMEVLKNIRSVFSSIMLCKKDLARNMPDALILIDYPGFNLRMARFGSKLGIKVIYYISPKVWAWNESRVKSIKKYVDHMITIFPFETEFYQKFGFKVDYVGNPLVDVIENRSCKGEDFEEFIRRNGLSRKPVISILAGSRIQEIESCLPVMLSVIHHYPDYQFVIAGAPSVDPEVYIKLTKNKIPLLFNQTYATLQQSSAAMIVSGTATLEAALIGVPVVVCYRSSFISYHIAKRLIKVKYISLVNLIMKREVVRELIQHEFNSENLKNELDKLLPDSAARQKMLADMENLKKILGREGASGRAAERILGYLNASNS